MNFTQEQLNFVEQTMREQGRFYGYHWHVDDSHFDTFTDVVIEKLNRENGKLPPDLIEETLTEASNHLYTRQDMDRIREMAKNALKKYRQRKSIWCILGLHDERNVGLFVDPVSENVARICPRCKRGYTI